MSYLKYQYYLIVLSGTLLTFLIGKFYWNRRKLYLSSAKMDGPFAWPIVGNGFLFIGGNDAILRNMMDLFTSYKSPIRVWLGQKLFFAICKPKDLEIILNKSLHKGELYKFLTELIETGLITAEVNIWRNHRKYIAPTFNPKILETFQPIFVEHASSLVKKLERNGDDGIFDVYPILWRCAFEIICETAMGRHICLDSTNSLMDDIAQAFKLFCKRSFKIWYHPAFIWNMSKSSKELRIFVNRIHRFLNTIVIAKYDEHRKRKNLGDEYFEETPPKKVFLDYLIELSEDGVKWTNKELQDEVLTLAIAGSESTAIINSFSLVMLGMHPEIQERVHEELTGIFGNSDRQVNLDDLPQMIYLERVIKETMRLFPIAPLLVRELHEDVNLETQTIPEGSSCVIGIIHAHRDPEVWPNPLKFDPDRFLPEEVAKRHPYSYIPFSAGPRNCIGIKYAMMSMKTVLSTIMRRFKVYTDYKSVEDINVKMDLLLRTENGHRIALELR